MARRIWAGQTQQDFEREEQRQRAVAAFAFSGGETPPPRDLKWTMTPAEIKRLMDRPRRRTILMLDYGVLERLYRDQMVGILDIPNWEVWIDRVQLLDFAHDQGFLDAIALMRGLPRVHIHDVQETRRPGRPHFSEDLVRSTTRNMARWAWMQLQQRLEDDSERTIDSVTLFLDGTMRMRESSDPRTFLIGIQELVKASDCC